jgi:hypothetical protein
MATRSRSASAPLTFDLSLTLIGKIESVRRKQGLKTASEVVRHAIDASVLRSRACPQSRLAPAEPDSRTEWRPAAGAEWAGVRQLGSGFRPLRAVKAWSLGFRRLP